MKHAKRPRNYLSISFVTSGLFCVIASYGCSPPQKNNDATLSEFENSTKICLDISNFAAEKSKSNTNLDAASIFAEKKSSERRILVDLIGNYQGVIASFESEGAKTKSGLDPKSVANNAKTGPALSGATAAGSQLSLVDETKGGVFLDSARADGSNAGCRGYLSGATYSGIPPHYSQVKDATTAKQIVSKYCKQLQVIDSSACKYVPSVQPSSQSQSGTKLCANLQGQKPDWISENCEVISASSLGGIKKFAGEACKIISKAAANPSPSGCSAEILTGICAAHAKGAGDVFDYLNSITPSDEKLDQQMIDTITGVFYKTAFACVSSLGKTALKDAIKANPAGSAAYWASKTLGDDYVKKVLSGYKPNVALDAAKSVALAVCSAAANSIAESVDAVPPQMYTNDCGPRTPAESQARVASCFRTTASACDSLSGKVDFAKIVGAKSGGVKITADVVSAAAQAGCSFAGNWSKAACGAISESTKQILEAIRTGNNSWADCAGTTKMGQCIGARIGSGGWTNNNGFTQAVGEGENAKKDCCWCIRTWYESDWGYDKAWKSENFVGVIQQGDIASGNCPRPGGKPQGHYWWQPLEKRPSGNDVYYRYSQCNKVTLKGGRCIAGVEYYENDRLSGKKIREESWEPAP
jgi:hypothetical protein